MILKCGGGIGMPGLHEIQRQVMPFEAWNRYISRFIPILIFKNKNKK